MVGASPRKRQNRKPSRRSIKIHRNYTVEEAARVTGCAKGTIRRWVSSGTLPAIVDQRPYLILGEDLRAHLAARRPAKRSLRPHECYCFTCKVPRSPALGMIEFVPLTPTTGNLKALCEQCLTVMHKAIARSALAALAMAFDVTEQQAPRHLVDTADPSLNDNFDQEPKADA